MEYAKGHHRKTNSDAHKYGVCDLQRKAPVDEGKKQTVAATLHKPKGSLEDYVAKKAQYKLRRAKKVQSSTSYGGQGSGDSRFQSHGSSGGIPKKDFLAATIDVRQTIVSKISMRHNGGTGALSPRLGTKDSSKHTIATTISAGGTVPPRAAWMIQPLDRPFVSGQPEGEENCDTTALYIEDDSETGLEQKPERVQKGPPQRLVLQGRKETAALNLSGSSISSTGIVRHSACGHYNYSTGFMGEKCVLRSHMDSVRDVQFSCGLNYLVTASEDCMVKLWDIKGLKKNGILHPSRIEPCFSYRGHTGPLFAVCVGNGLQKEDHFIYSAGSEGIIRIWGIPSIESSKYPPTNGKNFCVGVWTSHRDVVWQLVHHPTEGLLLSVSADGTVKMWKEFDISQLVDSVDKSTALRRCVMVDSNDCLLGAFVMRNTSQQYYEIPTSAAWLTGSHSGLLISYVSPMVGLFDRTTVLSLKMRAGVGEEQGTAEVRAESTLEVNGAAGQPGDRPS